MRIITKHKNQYKVSHCKRCEDHSNASIFNELPDEEKPEISLADYITNYEIDGYYLGFCDDCRREE